MFTGLNAEKSRRMLGLSKDTYLTFGSSAEVHDLGDTVVRMSTDRSSHCLMVLGNENGWAVPKLYCDYGAVCESDESPEYFYYWVGEFEKLHELTGYPDLEREFLAWLDHVLTLANLDVPLFGNDDNIASFKAALLSSRSEGRFEEVANTLIEMCAYCDGDFDMAASNFMVRPDTREIIVVDPAHGMEYFIDNWEARGRVVFEKSLCELAY